MKYNSIGDKYKVSCVGIGGHYGKMEEGMFEARYANVEDKEINTRKELILKAISSGINYFDTTWRNEVEMLSKVIDGLDIRDKMFINGMVLGAFSGSAAAGVDVCDYFNRWLDDRLKMMADNRFNSFMINAIEEEYDEAKCEKLVRLLERRRNNGDFDVVGFSCHKPELARRVADTFSEFEMIMLPYNYRNRRLEQAFEGYKGKASFIAMKPLVWAEYGIPFCALDNLPNANELLNIQIPRNTASIAIGFITAKEFITSTVCAVNNEKELDNLIQAGSTDFDQKNDDILNSYNNALLRDHGIPFFISAVLGDSSNRRLMFFGVTNLARALKKQLPDIPLNTENSDGILSRLVEELLIEAQNQGYGKYIRNC